MSVAFFNASELSNVASYLSSGPFGSKETAREVAKELAAYSVGNAWAYNRQYGESVEPVSAADILRGVSLMRFDRERARGTLRLLSYNGATNAGREISLPGYFEALASLMSLALSRVSDELERATAR